MKARCRWCEQERQLRKDGRVREHSFWVVLPSGKHRLLQCPGSGSPPRSVLEEIAEQIMDDAKSYLPALSVYYHSGQLPREQVTPQ